MAAPDYSAFEDKKIKHLEMIQAVIARLGNDSFLVKGWALTVAGAFFGFAINATNPGLAWASLVPIILFWGLDVHFLRAERLFRVLFAYVRGDTHDIRPFSMDAASKSFKKLVKADSEKKGCASFWSTAIRPTLVLFYGILIIVAVVLVFLINAHSNVLQPRPGPTPTL